MERLKIVVRYADGRTVKGGTQDFFPNKPQFHLLPAAAGPSDEAMMVRVKELKAVFFVKDFNGNPQYNEQKKFAEGGHHSGRKVEVTFVDGEVLVGSTMGYDPQRPGFFLFPADPETNNLRVFVVSAAVSKISNL
jgi:hypothetical protein